MSVLSDLGIYPEAIEANAEKAEKFFDEFKSVYEELAPFDTFQGGDSGTVHDYAQTQLEETGTFDGELTNQIIGAYFSTVRDVVQSNPIEGLDINIDSFENCDDSHLNFSLDGGLSYQRYSGENSFRKAVYLHIAERMAEAMIEQDAAIEKAVNHDESIKGDLEIDFRSDIEAGNINGDDIGHFLATGEFKETAKEARDAYAKDIKQHDERAYGRD